MCYVSFFILTVVDIHRGVGMGWEECIGVEYIQWSSDWPFFFFNCIATYSLQDLGIQDLECLLSLDMNSLDLCVAGVRCKV